MEEKQKAISEVEVPAETPSRKRPRSFDEEDREETEPMEVDDGLDNLLKMYDTKLLVDMANLLELHGHKILEDIIERSTNPLSNYINFTDVSYCSKRRTIQQIYTNQ